MIENLFEEQVCIDRRATLKKNVGSGIILILGNDENLKILLIMMN
jgi:hypothetical protein